MMTYDQISAECGTIQKFLEEIGQVKDCDQLVSSLGMVNTYLARTGVLLAEAKYLLDQTTSKAFEDNMALIQSLGRTLANKFISSICDKESYLVNLLDRQNSCCVHEGDNIRTQISFAKEQLKLTRNGY